MSTVEVKNMKAKCLDRSSQENVVLHEVTFDLRDSGVWQPMSMQVMATDPMDAIKYVTNTYREN